MSRRMLWVLLFWVCWAGATAQAKGVREGMTRAEVEAELGRPLSVLVRGDTTVLNYLNDGRVELREGRAVRVVRVRHADDPPSAEELVAEEEARLAKAEAEEEEKYRREQAAAEAEWAAKPRSEVAPEGLRSLEESMERLTAEHEAGAAGAVAGEMGLHVAPAEFWTLLGVGALVQLALGMVVLKLAFLWADVHADWGQMVWPALAGVLAGAAVRAGGFAVWNVTEFFRLDDAVSYVALVVALMKTTHACTWQRAFAVAAAAKLMAIIVWVFLSVALMQLLFG